MRLRIPLDAESFAYNREADYMHKNPVRQRRLFEMPDKVSGAVRHWNPRNQLKKKLGSDLLSP